MKNGQIYKLGEWNYYVLFLLVNEKERAECYLLLALWLYTPSQRGKNVVAKLSINEVTLQKGSLGKTYL